MGSVHPSPPGRGRCGSGPRRARSCPARPPGMRQPGIQVSRDPSGSATRAARIRAERGVDGLDPGHAGARWAGPGRCGIREVRDPGRLDPGGAGSRQAGPGRRGTRDVWDPGGAGSRGTGPGGAGSGRCGIQMDWTQEMRDPGDAGSRWTGPRRCGIRESWVWAIRVWVIRVQAVQDLSTGARAGGNWVRTIRDLGSAGSCRSKCRQDPGAGSLDPVNPGAGSLDPHSTTPRHPKPGQRGRCGEKRGCHQTAPHGPFKRTW